MPLIWNFKEQKLRALQWLPWLAVDECSKIPITVDPGASLESISSNRETTEERSLVWLLSHLASFCMGWGVIVCCMLVGIILIWSIEVTSTDPAFLLIPSSFTPVNLKWTSGPVSSSADWSRMGMNKSLFGQDDMVVEDGHYIQQTSIRGQENVDQFQAHVSCFGSAGNWVYDPMPRKIPWFALEKELSNAVFNFSNSCDRLYAHVGGVFGDKADAIALSNDSNRQWIWSVREELKWVWQINNASCPWHRMDRDELCRRIGARGNVLIVGDSLNHLIYYSILNNLAMKANDVVNQLIAPGIREELCADILGKEGQGFTVQFVRNDLLSLTNHSTIWGIDKEDPWIHLLSNDLNNFKVLVLNRGAHFRNDEVFVEGLRTTFSFLRDHFPHLLVIFRNTMTGHEDCHLYHAPFANPKTDTLGYHWGEFERQNKLAKSLVEEFHYVYVDVARPLLMRPDGHMLTDCLHYCIPGPLDFVAEMLYNVFLLLK